MDIIMGLHQALNTPLTSELSFDLLALTRLLHTAALAYCVFTILKRVLQPLPEVLAFLPPAGYFLFQLFTTIWFPTQVTSPGIIMVNLMYAGVLVALASLLRKEMRKVLSY